MSYKPLLGLTLIVIFAALISGCFEESPKEIADKYIKAATHLNLEEAYKYVSEEGKTQTPLEKAIAERTKLQSTGLGAILELISARTSHKIGEVTIEGDTAKVAYTITSPDVKPLFQDPQFIELIRSKGNDPEHMRKTMEAHLKSDAIKMQDQEKTLSMIKENGAWKVKSLSLQ